MQRRQSEGLLLLAEKKLFTSLLFLFSRAARALVAAPKDQKHLLYSHGFAAKKNSLFSLALVAASCTLFIGLHVGTQDSGPQHAMCVSLQYNASILNRYE
tara:strand:- start:244 stop:543 length:300 start_codon:yes stop_codon:yes gene_type:complete